MKLKFHHIDILWTASSSNSHDYVQRRSLCGHFPIFGLAKHSTRVASKSGIKMTIIELLTERAIWLFKIDEFQKLFIFCTLSEQHKHYFIYLQILFIMNRAFDVMWAVRIFKFSKLHVQYRRLHWSLLLKKTDQIICNRCCSISYFGLILFRL